MTDRELLERAARAAFEARYPSKILWKRGGSVFAEDIPEAKYVDQSVQRDWELWLEAWSAAVAIGSEIQQTASGSSRSAGSDEQGGS